MVTKLNTPNTRLNTSPQAANVNINDLIESAAKIVPLPSINTRINTLLKDPDCTSGRLAEVVAYDPGLAARVLKVANAVYHLRCGQSIDTLTQAITLIGTNNLKNLVLATSTAQLFKKIDSSIIDMDAYWQHSVGCALTARALAQRCHPNDSERNFVAGLLHDIGEVIICYQLPDIARKIWGKDAPQEYGEHLLEQSLLGFDHGEVGAELLRSWELPSALWEPVLYHHAPLRAKECPVDTAILAIASTVVDHLDLGRTLFDEEQLKNCDCFIDNRVWIASGLAPTIFQEVIHEVYDQFFTVSEIILQPSSH